MIFLQTLKGLCKPMYSKDIHNSDANNSENTEDKLKRILKDFNNMQLTTDFCGRGIVKWSKYKQLSTTLDDLAERLIQTTSHKANGKEFTLKERIIKIEIGNRLNDCYLNSDELILSSNYLTRLLILVRKLFITDNTTRSSIEELKKDSLLYTKEEFIKIFSCQDHEIADHSACDSYDENGVKVKILDLYNLAKEDNIIEASYGLGLLYELGGEGVIQSKKTAFDYYQDTAEKGHTNAQYRLGCMLERGEDGVNKDFKKAVSLYEKAAEKGHVEAIKSLSRIKRTSVLVNSSYRQQTMIHGSAFVNENFPLSASDYPVVV